MVQKNKKCMWETNPKQAMMLLNPQIGYEYTECSSYRTDWICPTCGNIIKNKSIQSINRYKLSCPICSDGISYPEKLFLFVIKQLNIKFKYQITNNDLDWCKGNGYNVKYDFYIPSINCIVETHGGQHYEESSRGRSLKEEQNNDKFKERLAKKNGIDNYIQIDCRVSELEWIKNSIVNSQLNDLLDFSNINWNIAHKNSLKSKVLEACDLWNSGNQDLNDIASLLDLKHCTIRNYLKKCASINLCNYNSQSEQEKSHDKIREIIQQKVICKNTNEIFNSIFEATEHYKISVNSISACCSGFRLYAGKINGEKLKWDYCDDSILKKMKDNILKFKDYDIIIDKNNVNQKCAVVCNIWNKGNVSIYNICDITNLKYNTILSYLNRCSKLKLCNYDGKSEICKNIKRKVICLNNNKIFNSITEAERYYNINNIGMCCLNKIQYAGETNGINLKWMYYDEYLTTLKSNIDNKLNSYINNKYTSVICLNNKMVFKNIADAVRWCGLSNNTGISLCISNKQKSAGKLPDGTPLKWMRLDDYNKLKLL